MAEGPAGRTEGPTRPWSRSLRTRLGLVVVAAVLAASGLASLASAAGVAPLVAVPVAVALGLLVTQLLAAGLIAPLRDMTAATRAMAAGDYDVRVETVRADEVGELARSFTAMAAELGSVDRQRRDLVANVSHELRTPVAALRAVLENLADGVVPADERRLGVALAQAERLSVLVGDLLDLGRLDSGLVPLDVQRLPLDALVDGVLTEARSVSGSRVVLVADVTAGLDVAGDRGRLHQALGNLVDNALRHAPEGSTVTVTGRAAPGGVRLDVRDEGPGIAPERRERVFERFETTAADGGGTGLGLAIARWIAVLHGGSLTVLDPTDGDGALLRLDLPHTPPADSSAPPRTTPRKDPAMSWTTPAAPATAPRRKEPVPPRPATTWWPETRPAPRPGLLVAALAVGTGAALAADQLAETTLAQTLVLWGMTAVAVWPARGRLDGADRVAVALAVLLGAVPVLRDADWIASLSVVAAGGLVTATVVGARTLAAVFASGVLVPLAGVRGLPWLGRTVEAGVGRTSWRTARTAAVSVVLVGLVGGLLASGDAVFAGVVDAVLPDLALDLGETVPRTLLALFVAGLALTGAYSALNPPALTALDRVARPRPRSEWLVPVSLVDAVLAVFLLGQAAALFGGETFVQGTTGLTYAEYARTGFGQMVAVTLVVLALVSWAARRAGPTDRAAARLALGLLVTLTLLVVVSALSRMATYEDAFGLTRLRLLVFVFEGWLGLLLLGVLAAGVAWNGRWLARTALLTGAAAMLALALANPDARIAGRNLDAGPGRVDVDVTYLEGLSTDAYGELPPALRSACAEEGADDVDLVDGWLDWNLGRARAETLCR